METEKNWKTQRANGPTLSKLLRQNNRPIALVIGCGAVGSGIAEALLQHSDYFVILAGKSPDRARALAQNFAAAGYAGRVGATHFDSEIAEECVRIMQSYFVPHARRIKLLVLAAGKAMLDDPGADPLNSETLAIKENAPNFIAKMVPFLRFAPVTDSVVVVSSIAAGFPDDDPRMYRMHSYRRAARGLEFLIETMPSSFDIRYRTVIMWRCPLVQGDTMHDFKEHGIDIPKDGIPTPYEAVVATLLPDLREAGLCT